MKTTGYSISAHDGGVERRSGVDRRTRRFGDIRWLIKTGRRRRLRRRSDCSKLFLFDYYSPSLFYIFSLILMLSVVDALLTLWLVDKGATEINPLMAYYLTHGPEVFMTVKYMLTAAAVFITVVFHYAFVTVVYRFSLKRVLEVMAGCFALVVGWEIFLIMRFLM